MIKPCHLGKAGVEARNEAFELIKTAVIPDPLRVGYNMGYRKAATLLNKHGYRTHKKRKWTPKSVANFYYNRSIRFKSSSNVKTSKTSNKPTSLEIIRHILNSNLDKEVQLNLLSLFVASK
jgi:hypothetical protein